MMKNVSKQKEQAEIPKTEINGTEVRLDENIREGARETDQLEEMKNNPNKNQDKTVGTEPLKQVSNGEDIEKTI